MQLRFALEDVCDRISSLQQFAEVLEVEHLMRDFLENEKYTTQDIHEKVAKCMSEKRSRSREDLDWYYWRNILLRIDEGELVEDIEEKYPALLQDERIDISDVAHKAFDEFGILAHDASKKELFEKIKIKLTDRIKVCVGAGKENTFAVRKVKEIPALQDNYFEKYKILEKIKMYDFSSIKRHEECRILKTLYKWLQKNDDGGFCIKGYDLQRHLELISVSYVNKVPKDSYILLYSKIYNVIFHIDTNSVDIKKSMRNNRSNIRTLCTLNPCLNNASFVYIPVTLFDPLKHKIDDKIVCKTCINLKLVVSVEIFKTLESFEEWLGTVSNELKVITCELKENNNISDDFFRNIMTFMSFDSLALPSFTKNPKNAIKEVQKIIMLTPEQQDVIYSINKHKIIKGSFGSGKTVVAQKIIKLVSQKSKELELVYYIFHESDSGFINVMQKLAKELKKENLKACRRSDLVKDNKLLSSLLQYLLDENKGRTIHVFIEEFNGEILDKVEVEKVKNLLENIEFKNSHIVIVAQSMESKRTETDDQLQTMLFETYQFEKLVKETEFKIFNLSYLLRSSLYINDIIHATIPILENVIFKSVIPKNDSKLNSKSFFLLASNASSFHENNFNLNLKNNKVPVIKVNKNFKRPITDLTTAICSPQKRCRDDNYSINSKNTTIIDNTSNNKSDDKEVKIESSYSYDKNHKQERKTKTVDENVTYNITDDTSKFLKHCTILSEKYSSKRNIQSSYSYIGDRKNAHNVKGKQPVVYYPFHVKYKNFVHQIYSLCKVLKVITNVNEEQVIICMNKVSMNTIKIALEINKTKWTNDPKLFSTSEFHVLLADYTSVRGCEFLNVILVYSLDEQHLKHNLVDCISRCVLNLIVIVLNQGVEDETLAAILNEWINKKLVTVSSEDYLKNVTNEELKIFELINNDLLHEQFDIQSMDVNDPKVIQKLKSFGRPQSDNNYASLSAVETSSDNSSGSKELASKETFEELWLICKKAAPNKNVAMLSDALRQKNLDVNSLYKNDEAIPLSGTLLYCAIVKGDVDIVKWLLETNVDVNKADDKGETPLYRSVIDDSCDIVKLLLQEENIDVNAAHNGYTPLHRAVRLKNDNHVKMLLEAGNININAANNNGYTPLHKAVRYGHDSYVKLLLKTENININAADNYGYTPLHKAVRYERDDQVKILLESENININAADNDGYTPLHEAVRYEHGDLVKMLLESENININAADNYGYTPLHEAVRNEHDDQVKLLLESENININAANNDGVTPLHVAVRNKRNDHVKILLETENININAADNNGNTPLHDAVNDNKIKIVRLLLQHDNIDLKLVNNDGNSPLYSATRDGRDSIKKLFRKHVKKNK